MLSINIGCKSIILSIMVMILISHEMLSKNSRPIKVFILAGQSNMNGYGSEVNDISPLYNTKLPQVQIWNLSEEKWDSLPLVNAIWGPKKQSLAAFGPELSFSQEIVKEIPNHDIRLIKYAANGTALYDDWEPDKGAQYLAFKKTMDTALQDLSSKNIKYEIAGMLWLQGESDAKEMKGKDYKNNLRDFIKWIRKEFKIPNLPFVIARVRDYYGKGIQAKMVRDAQVSLAESDKFVEWFDTDDCGPLVKGGHYNSDGLIEIGKRFSTMFIEIEGKKKTNKALHGDAVDR